MMILGIMSTDRCWWMLSLEEGCFVEARADILLFLYVEEPVIVFHIQLRYCLSTCTNKNCLGKKLEL